MALALRVNGVYGILAGLLLIFPSLAASVFAYPVKDPAVTSAWGVDILVVGLLSIAASSDVARHGSLGRIFALGLLLTAVDLFYFWMTGAFTARNVLAPIVINLGLAAWIWMSRGRAA